ncbi:chondroitin proteoglycan 2 [Nasonia vitripennis]|uniref:Chitin-binding type-2 domain-containing protein n=1 Tax=Nasonia vitripennis TaxID=7425 RepID=A0A7M7LIY8_NASVI|nr:chondroitin proteoglycan 2 [Nasonia vitripennis]
MQKLTFTLILLLSIAASLAVNSTTPASPEPEITIGEGSGSSEDDTTPAPTTTERPDSLDCQGECPGEDPIETSVYLAHLDCEKFCQCSNGRAIVLHCPAHLQFNTDLNVCDWPDSANCTGIGGVLEQPEVPPVNSILVDIAN